VNGRGSQKQTAGCSRRRGRISVELDVAMGRQQARNEQAVHYYVGLARDPGRRALGSPEFWARSAKGLPSAGGGLRATALTTPWLHVARRTSGWINARESVDWPGGARCDDTGPECRVPVLCRLCRAAHGPWPTAHWGSVNMPVRCCACRRVEAAGIGHVKKGFPPASLEPLTLSVTTQSIQPAST
jgi:hypothetical protein